MHPDNWPNPPYTICAPPYKRINARGENELVVHKVKSDDKKRALAVFGDLTNYGTNDSIEARIIDVNNQVIFSASNPEDIAYIKSLDEKNRK